MLQKVVILWALRGKSGLPDSSNPAEIPDGLEPVEPPKP
jgi:hypothetical protein